MASRSRAPSGDEVPVENESPIARVVREAIEAVAAPEVRHQIMHRALHMARLLEVPDSGEPLRTFVDRHLRTATAFYLGNDAAEAVLNHLYPLVSLAQEIGASTAAVKRNSREPTRPIECDRPDSGVSRKAQPSHDVELDTSKYPTVQPLGSALPMVFVATRNPERCDGIKTHLGDAAAVQQIQDVVAFLDNLKATASLSPLLVIDCVQSSVQPSTIATLSDELPRGSGVLLWGATDRHRRLVDVATRDRGWLRCDADTTPGDVAALIRVLLDQ